MPKILQLQDEILECQLQFSKTKPNYMRLKAENRSKCLNVNQNFLKFEYENEIKLKTRPQTEFKP